MKTWILLPLLTFAALISGCNAEKSTNDQAKNRSDTATAAAVGDASATTEGIRERVQQQALMGHRDDINLNAASRATLESLPGITPALANRILAGRPYNDPTELRTRHILTPAQFEAVFPRLTTAN